MLNLNKILIKACKQQHENKIKYIKLSCQRGAAAAATPCLRVCGCVVCVECVVCVRCGRRLL